MAVDNYISAVVGISAKTMQSVDRLAAEYGYSRTKTLQLLIEEALDAHGEELENSSTFKNGSKNKRGIPKRVENRLRNVL